MIIETVEKPLGPMPNAEKLNWADRISIMKRQGRKIAVLTAYDAPTAKAEEESGIDLILVGDSVGTNILGYTSEKEVTLSDIGHHVGAVRRGAPHTPIIADLPYQTYETPAEAVANARKLIAAGADLVKFEGSRPDLVQALVQEGMAVCGHLGLMPQHHTDRRLKGRKAQEAVQLVMDAIALDQAGITMLVLELVPDEVGALVSRVVKAPTIGIGAGGKTDGQVLVITDVLGLWEENFHHSRRYQPVGSLMREAAKTYAADVRAQTFPTADNSYPMDKEELAILKAELAHRHSTL